MSLRISKPLRISVIAASVVLVSACSSGSESHQPEGDTIGCAIGAGVEMADVCVLEQIAGEGSATFILHHPDGGFRRIAFDPETRELGVADGAEVLQISESSTDEQTEFSIGADLYRLPAAMLRAPSE